MKYFITFILGIICGPHTGTGSEIPIINVLGMEQEDRFGLKSIPAILMGVDHINSLYSDVFQLNVLRTTFGPTCSPIGKAIAFADVYYHNTIYASFGPGEYPLVVVRHIKKGTFVVMKEGSCFYIYLYTTISIFIENIKVH
jgi:hypothetical protein